MRTNSSLADEYMMSEIDGDEVKIVKSDGEEKE